MSEGSLPPGGSAAFQATLQKLAADFARLLPQRLAEAAQALQDCRSQPGDDARLDELVRMLHTLAGTAGTFGQQRIGDEARAIESLLLSLRGHARRNAASFEEAAARIDALVAHINKP